MTLEAQSGHPGALTEGRLCQDSVINPTPFKVLFRSSKGLPRMQLTASAAFLKGSNSVDLDCRPRWEVTPLLQRQSISALRHPRLPPQGIWC